MIYVFYVIPAMNGDLCFTDYETAGLYNVVFSVRYKLTF